MEPLPKLPYKFEEEKRRGCRRKKRRASPQAQSRLRLGKICAVDFVELND
jgi:hypothetical protein